MPPGQSGGGDGPAWPGLRAGFSHSGQARQKGPANVALSLGSFHTRGHVGSREEPQRGAPRPGPLRRTPAAGWVPCPSSSSVPAGEEAQGAIGTYFKGPQSQRQPKGACVCLGIGLSLGSGRPVFQRKPSRGLSQATMPVSDPGTAAHWGGARAAARLPVPERPPRCLAGFVSVHSGRIPAAGPSCLSRGRSAQGHGCRVAPAWQCIPGLLVHREQGARRSRQTGYMETPRSQPGPLAERPLLGCRGDEPCLSLVCVRAQPVTTGTTGDV